MPESNEPQILDLAAASVADEAAMIEAARHRPRRTKGARDASRARRADGLPLRHLANAPKAATTPGGVGTPVKSTPGSEAREPWRPGSNLKRGGSPGRPKERTFAEDARDVLSHGVPTKLRALVALRTGLPLDVAAHMSLRQAVILLLIHDAIEKGEFDKLDRILDRTDPKSRRVEHRGGMAHLHAIAPAALGMSEANAAEIYRQMVQGGPVVALVEFVEGPQAPPALAASADEA